MNMLSDEELRIMSLTLEGDNTSKTILKWLIKVRDRTEAAKDDEYASLKGTNVRLNFEIMDIKNHIAELEAELKTLRHAICPDDSITDATELAECCDEDRAYILRMEQLLKIAHPLPQRRYPAKEVEKGS